jgi:hypothetical protein
MISLKNLTLLLAVLFSITTKGGEEKSFAAACLFEKVGLHALLTFNIYRGELSDHYLCELLNQETGAWKIKGKKFSGDIQIQDTEIVLSPDRFKDPNKAVNYPALFKIKKGLHKDDLDWLSE